MSHPKMDPGIRRDDEEDNLPVLLRYLRAFAVISVHSRTISHALLQLGLNIKTGIIWNAIQDA